ncbi:MAG: hypothetical protein AAB865_00710 [Patescibacteria group bacterium]
MALFKRSQRTSFGSSINEHPLFLWTTIASLVLIAIMVALPFWKLAPIGLERPEIPLHYNVYFGVDLIGPWYKVFFLPLIGVILLLANRQFAIITWEKEKMLSYFFAVATLVVELALTVAVVLVVLLNL